jgi:LmbE family N-acetylglucosaminyl deacetylase
MSRNRVILIVAAHPDDEVLGAGGTIHNAAKAGDAVHVLFLSSGVGSRDKERQNPESRMASARKALGLLGCENIVTADFPDNEFDNVGLLEISKFIESQIRNIKPEIVFTNFHSDLNVDHRITAEATLVATRPKPESSVNAVFFYEVLSSTGWQFGASQFSPNYFVDITESTKGKELALAEYAVEMDSSPNARSIESAMALAKFRGNFIGFEFAEAFEVGFIRSKS